ncbi:ABC transporter substrate-binding protein [Flavobacterium restrictum]|uniref:ABC transporter substrate-binding protein n=1 Tax=Flavobacterium restrictum TaxID=2594428 RepID=A0A553E2G7_9FLAO|nr:ABC transporter substrate-binding protein [Flavobacterium restrictum]TRX39241.1 ABC transporter substrate-binding protein [Flavobacterium restrictum]
MRTLKKYALLIFIFCFCLQCKKEEKSQPQTTTTTNTIHYAKGFEIYKHNQYSVLKVTQPWPNATTTFTYVLKEKGSVIPEEYASFPQITIPIKSIVITSTTHVPPLELLGVENTIIGFPNTDYISSSKTRSRIDQGKIREVGSNETLNTEVLLDMQPDVIVSFGLNATNPTLDLLQKNGLKVLLNGDWNEQSPLGKAEWIKFFGALYGLDAKANTVFNQIEQSYTKTLQLAQKATTKPTVLCGATYQEQWYVPQGESWAALFLKEAKTNYLWQNTKGTGSLTVPFENVLVQAKNADFWFAPGDFSTLKQLLDSNPHYSEFDAFKNKKVFSYALNKGAKGGIMYFELAGSRPDWVLQDMIAIFHPELLPNYKPVFFQKLQ